MARRTKEEALATRQLLLETAEAIFLQHGFARTSLNDIACAAGLTRGAVYWHFEDKAALYNALMDRLSAHFSEQVQAIADARGAEPVDALRRLVLLPLKLLHEDEQVRRLFTIALHRVEFSEDLSLIWQRYIDSDRAYLELMEQLFRAADREPRWCRLHLPPQAAALGLFALVNGLITYATLDPTRVSCLAHAREVLDAYLAGVGCVLPTG